MAREFVNGFDPSVTSDNDAFNAASGSGTWTNTFHRLVQWFKVAGTGVTNIGHRPLSSGLAFDKTYRWFLFGIHFDGTLITNQRIVILSMGHQDHAIAIEQDTDSSTFKIALGEFTPNGNAWTGRGTSTRTYSTHDNLIFRYQTDGVRHKLWIRDVDDVSPSLDLEIDVADTGQSVPTVGSFGLRNGHGTVNALASGQDMYWRMLQAWQSNSESDRPGVLSGSGAGIFEVMHPDADTAEDDYTPVGQTDQFDNWNDMASINEAEYNVSDHAFDEQQVSTLPPCANAHTGTVGGVMWHMRFRAAAAVKTAVSFARIKDDGGAASEVEQASEPTGTYIARAAGFRVPPDGGSWEDLIHTDGIFNSASADQQLSGGVSTPASNDVNMRFAELMVVACSAEDDPPAFTLQAGPGVALGSGNMGII